MEKTISETTESCQALNGSENRLFHAGRSEFDVPKIPIEVNEMKNYIISRQFSRSIQNERPYQFQTSNIPNGEERICFQLSLDSPPNVRSNSVTFPDRLSTHVPSKTHDAETQFTLDDAEPSLRANSAIPPGINSTKGRVVEYQRVCIGGDHASGAAEDDLQEAAVSLLKAMELREKYMRASLQKNGRIVKWYLKMASIDSKEELQSPRMNCYYSAPATDKEHPIHPPEFTGDPFEVKYWPEALAVSVSFKKGIAQLKPLNETTLLPNLHTFTLEEFIRDEKTMRMFVANGPLKSFAFRRLCYLSSKFSLHNLLNEAGETLEQKNVPHRDFYNIRKVDTHVHAASCMNQKHLLRFIKKCIRTRQDDFVCLDKSTGQPLTLKQLMEHLGITAYEMNIDNLDVHADRNTFQRFDKFNAKYNPIGQSQLREVFLKTDNFCNGIFFAQVLKEVFSDLEESKYQNAEPRLSIYGKSPNEWDDLAKWAINFRVYSPNIRWIVQVPRLYDVYRSKDVVGTFQEMIENIFQPLFEVTLDPISHPELHAFLEHVSAFDSVDDESKMDMIHFDFGLPTADQWDRHENPPYAYYIFYMYANIAVLNQLRQHRGMHMFAFRPHCGEAGSVSHLISTFLLAESINHGLLLRKAPVLQYLFYLCQIGLAMSPLSNNSLFLEYHRNPLIDFLAKGLHVCLSTDDPLQFHFTKEPLMEEYSIAAQVWKLSFTDMCELARNSVLISGFPDVVKSHWLGLNYWREEAGVASNDITRTNLPNIRVAYRHETLTNELHLLIRAALDAHRRGGASTMSLCASPLQVIDSNLLQMTHLPSGHSCGDCDDDEKGVSK